MQYNLPLFPKTDEKKTERLTIAITPTDKLYLQGIIRDYKNRQNIILSESEFGYIAFKKGLTAAMGVLMLPDDVKKIF